MILELGTYLVKHFHGRVQRAMPFLTSPLGARGEISPLGGMFTPSFTPIRGEHSQMFRRMKGQTDNFIPRG
jgi:hypothetical protein